MLVLSLSWDEGGQAQGMPSSCLFQGWVKFYVRAWCISLEVSLEVMGMGTVGSRNPVPA